MVNPTSEVLVQVFLGVSPEEEGVNDLLIIEGIKDYRSNRVSILNRHGTLVLLNGLLRVAVLGVRSDNVMKIVDLRADIPKKHLRFDIYAIMSYH